MHLLITLYIDRDFYALEKEYEIVSFLPTGYLNGWLHSSTTAYVQTNPHGATL